MRSLFAALCAAAAVAVACDDANSPEPLGTLVVSVTTSGGDPDEDGYTVIAGSAGRNVTPTGTARFDEFASGPATVELLNAAPNCTVTGGATREITVRPRRVTEVTFLVTCFPTGVFIKTATTGIDLDPDGYTISINGLLADVLRPQDSIAISRLAPDTAAVELGALSDNCTVTLNPRSVQVVVKQMTRVTFGVTCGAATGNVQVRTATTGVDHDPDGFMVRLSTGRTGPLLTSGSLTFDGVPGGTHTATLEGVAPNCTVQGANPRPVTVLTGGPARLTVDVLFEVICQPTHGTLRITTATTGVDLDPNGYYVEWDHTDYYGYNVMQIGSNAARSFQVPVGTHDLFVYDVASNCTVEGGIPRVTIVGDATTELTLRVSCAVLGALGVTVTTTGPAPAGYTLAIEGMPLRQVAANGTTTVTGVPPGNRRVTLGVPVNCVSQPSFRTVSVPLGVTLTTSFDVACVALTPLAFASTEGNNTDIYRANPDGSARARLTTHPAVDDRPEWSPDGNRIAFQSQRDGNWEIYVMNADGSDQRRVTSNVFDDVDPAWSPDGTRIVFASNRDGDLEIHVMNADGSGVVAITDHPAVDGEPAWSPDGSRIAFRSQRTPAGDIYVMNPDGSGITRLTSGTSVLGAEANAEPAWSPDGAMIAWSRAASCDPVIVCRDIFVMNANGSGARNVMPWVGIARSPSWSATGEAITFSHSPCYSDYYYYYQFYCTSPVISGLWVAGSVSIPLTLGAGVSPSWRR